MAIQKIEYQNKVSIQDDPAVAEINKVTDSNMNEIKSVVNNNADILEDIDLSDYYTKEEIDEMIGGIDAILQELDTGSGV
jgi:hypothetical protein